MTSFADAQGNTIRAPFAGTWPLDMLPVVTFEPHAGKGLGTVITLQSSALGANAEEQRTFDDGQASMTGGWGGTFEQLEAYLAKLGQCREVSASATQSRRLAWPVRRAR